MLSLVLGCASAKRKHAEQQIVPADTESAVGAELSKNLDQAYGAWKEPRVEQILNEIVAKIVASDASYKDSVSDARIHLLSTGTPLVAAGLNKTVYVSKGLLNALQYETELAYMLAMQLALLKEGVPARQVATLQGESVGESLIVLPTTPLDDQADFLRRGWFEAGGLFDYGNEAYLKAEAEAVRLIWSSKYDPRGAVSLVQRLDTPKERANYRVLGKILPDAEDQLRVAREEVAKLSPLRDPIVKSVAFTELQGRLNTRKAKHKKHAN